MNTNILKKCLDELSKEDPKLDYIRGMLETLLEMQPMNLHAVGTGVGVGIGTGVGKIELPTAQRTIPMTANTDPTLPPFSSASVVKAQQNTSHE